VLRALAVLAAAVLLSGCGDDFDPEGRPVGVTLQPVPEPHPFGEGAQLPVQQPVVVWSPYPGWEDVASVTPSPLPRPLDQGSDCRSGLKVTVRLQNGEDSVSTFEEVEYGPCRRPAELEPLRRTLERLLRRRDAAERRKGRYPVGARLAALSGPPKFRTLARVSVRFGEQGWGQVAAAIPTPLPRPYEAYGYDYDFGCRSGYYEVTVFFLNGAQAEYGPCLRPPEIDPFVTNV